MSAPLSNAAEWFTLLEPATHDAGPRRSDDPRLGEVIESWTGDDSALTRGRAVLIGFPQDEGVRRNHGRPGAALAPAAIRRCLDRLTPTDAARGMDLRAAPPLDLGNLRIDGSLEDSQMALAAVVSAVLARGAIPVVLGGGHETAFGHFLGYSALGKRMGVINVDAHLDVRSPMPSGGTSGSSFRQMLEHELAPLVICLGAQPHTVSQAHLNYLTGKGGKVRWASEMSGSPKECYIEACNQIAMEGRGVWISLDADVVNAAEVPAVSAPNPLGLRAADVTDLARHAGSDPCVSSFELVEISPPFDRDDQCARWAAVTLWHFLMGVAERRQKHTD